MISELKLLGGATKWLRTLALGLLGIFVSVAVALGVFTPAQSSSQGFDSEIDYYGVFDGSSTRATYATRVIPSTNVATLEAWIKPELKNATIWEERLQTIVAQAQDGVGCDAGRFGIYINEDNGSYSVHLAQTTTQDTCTPIDIYVGNGLVKAGSWTHVAAAINGTSYKVYVNGQEIASGSGLTINNVGDNGNPTFAIGGTGGASPSFFFKGGIDQVKVWESALTEDEVKLSMHERGAPAGVNGLVAEFDFNEGTGDTVYDRAGAATNLNATSLTRADVKQISSAPGGDTVIAFPRTYLPGKGGWTVPANATNFTALVVAGGGGGGGDEGGGGGAGGLTESALAPAASSTLSVVVGMGGFGADHWTKPATNGQDSALGGLSVTGGGAGGNSINTAGDPERDGQDGGSGGGAAGEGYVGGIAGSGIPGQGHDGSAGVSTVGRGGGGAGSAASGANGGAGRAVNIITTTLANEFGVGEISGSSVYFAGGGGGGGGNSSNTPGVGGLGGGSDGNGSSTPTAEAVPNTGGGGGGGGGNYNQGTWNNPYSGKSGASGVVIVRYTPTNDLAYTAGAKSDLYTSTTPLPTANNAAFTAEAWVYSSATPGTNWRTIFGGAADLSSASNRFLVAVREGYGVYVDVGDAAAWYVDVGFQLEQWTHVAISVTASSNPTVNLFIDGVLVHSWSGSYNRTTLGQYFTIGSGTNQDYLWSGQIDQVKIWGSVLDAADIAESMHSYQKGTRTAGDSLLAHYDFNDFTQGVVLDRTGNGKHLTLASSITDARFTSSQIIETGTAHTEQSYVKFNRSYLTATGGWTPPAGVTNYKALVVAGGGGGGRSITGTYENGGGGGAGGFIESHVVTSSQTLEVTVGQGGSGRTYPPTQGQSTSVLGQTAIGGGRGGSHANGYNIGGSGGSGGGGTNWGGGYAGGSGTDGQGYAGGKGANQASTNGGSGGGGGAGGLGIAGSGTSGGAGGPGKQSALTGTPVFYAAGGGGAGGTGGAGGSSIGGAGASSGSTDGESGAPNTGSGGGGNFSLGAATATFGGNGGSGVVILSWGPYLEVTQSPTVARAGDVFREAVKLQVMDESTGQPFSTSYPVTVTASANVLTLNGVLLTQSYTVQSSAVDGTVDYSGLGFASNVSGPVTLTFTSDQFVGTSLVVTPNFFPENVEIVTSGTTGGTFYQGEFFANSGTGTAIVNKDDLVAHLASYSTVISASGFISVKTSFTSQTVSDLVLKAGAYVSVDANQVIRTYGGDVVLWADSDQSAGGYVRLLNSSEICTTGGTCGTTNTGGGDIIIGGGAPDLDDPKRPGGYAVGSGGSDASDGTSDTSGVAIGRVGNNSNGARLFSAGGDISVKGQMSTSTANTWRAGVAVVGGSAINAGNGKIYLSGKATSSGGGGADGTIALGAWSGGYQITSMNTASDAIVIEGIDNDSSRTIYGIWEGHDLGVITSAGGFQLRANHINDNLDMDLSVSGVIVIEPQSTSLRDSENATSFAVDIVESSVTAGDTIRLISAPAGIRVGSASNSHNLTLGSSFGAAGSIELLGGSIDVTSDITIQSTSESAHILLKAKDWIDIRNGASSSTFKKLQTNNGDIIIWTDADGNGQGSFTLGNYNELNSANGVKSNTGSGGGRITIGGGSDTPDGDGHPTGSVADVGQRNGSVVSSHAILTGTNAAIYSGGGDVLIKADSNHASVTTWFTTGTKVWSGTGGINIISKNTALNHGMNMMGEFVSHASLSPAIQVTVETNATSLGAYYNDDGSAFELISTAADGGGITVDAIVGSTTNNGMVWGAASILSRYGPIDISTNGRIDWTTANARAIGAKASSDVITSTADVRIASNAFLDSTANTLSTISTSGAVTISPTSTHFDSDSEIQFTVDAGSFAFGSVAGVNSATKKVKISRDITAAGPISVAGMGITVDRGVDLISSANGAPILLKSRGWVDIDNLTATLAQTNDSDFSIIQSNNGDIILWADSDSDQQGLIWVAHNTRINSANGVYSYDAVSGGGDIIFAGGADDGSGKPSGSAWDYGHRSESTATSDMAVGFGKFVDVFSGGGDITVRASKKNSGGLSAFHFQSMGEYVSGTGQIVIEAVTTASGNVEAFEYWITAETEAGGLFSSHSTAEPAISISASIAGTSIQPIRVYNQNQANPTTFQSLSNTGGGLAFFSMMGATSTTVGTYLAAVNLLSKTGPITFDSNAVLSVANDGWNQFWGERSGTSVTESAADITIRANGIHGTALTVTMSTSGAIQVLPYGANFGAATPWAPKTFAGGGFSLGVDSAWDSAAHAVTIYQDVIAGGPIEIYGNQISLPTQGSDLVTSGLGDRIVLKSKTFIENANGTAANFSLIQSNNGDIIFWPNAADAGTGNLYLMGYTQVNSANGVKSKTASGGGRITMAGGSSVDGDGHPTGSFPGRSGRYALLLEDYSAIYTGGGDVFINVNSNIGEVAALFEANSLIWSGTGQIDARVASSATHASRLHMSWVSAATLSPAIEYRASVTNNWYAMYNDSGQTFTMASIAPVGGGISTSALTPSAGNTAHFLYGWAMESVDGDISFYTNGISNLNSSQARFFGATPSGEVRSSSADIYITSQNIPESTGNTASKVSTSGLVSIQPAASTFTANTRFRFDIEAGSLKIGDAADQANYTNAFSFDRPVAVRDGIEVYANSIDSATAATITSTGAEGGVTLSANANVQLGATVTSVGSVSVFGQDIYLVPTHDIVVSGQGNKILLKATRDIWSQNGSGTAEALHSKVQTNNGDIILWADADGNAIGGVLVGRYFQLNSANGEKSKLAVSGGGNIIIGGGTTSDANGYPTGYAGTSANWLTDRSVFLYYDFGVFTGGGDFIVRGRSNSSFGITLYPFSEFFTGTGKLEIQAVTTSTGNARGLAFIGTDFTDELNGGIELVSHSTNEPAVTLTGISSGSLEGVRLYGPGSANQITIASTATSGGGVEINAATANFAYAAFLRKANILSRHGDITLTGGSRIISFDWANEKQNYFGSRPGSAYVATSSANLSFRADNFDADFDSTFYNTSGDVEFLPDTANFFGSVWGNDVYANPYQVFAHNIVNVRNLTFGKPPLAGDSIRNVYIRNNLSVSGEIKIHGGNIIVGDGIYAGDLSAASSVSLIANGNIQAWEDITTQNGNIRLQSRALDAAEGGVWVNDANLRSNGGEILISGGADPYSSYAIGTFEMTDYIGVNLAGNPTITSAGGEIIIRGSQGSDNDPNDAAGVYLNNSQINSGAGSISIFGRLADQPFVRSDFEHSGILTYGATITSTTGGIELVGDATAITGNKNDKRGQLLWPVTISTTDGNITVSGTVNSSADDSFDLQIWLGGSSIRSTNGSVSILGQGSSPVVVSSTTVEAGNEILIQDDRPVFGSSTLTGSATVTIQSSSSDFITVPTTLGQLTANSGLSGLTLGRETETGSWTIDKAFTINGPITAYGGTINLQAAQVVTSESARVTLKSKGDIITTADGDITTDGGAIVLWSNSDNDTTAGGRIEVVSGTVLTSNGGDVVLAGGNTQDANGYPAGYAKAQNSSNNLRSIKVDGSLVSEEGDVILRASVASGTGNFASYGIQTFATITTTTGDIDLSSIYPAGDASSGGKFSMWLAGTFTTTDGDIRISGDNSAAGSSNTVYGIVAAKPTLRSTTGDISIVGKASPALGIDIHHWNSSGGLIVTTSGSVSVAGRAGNQLSLRYSNIYAGTGLQINADGFFAESGTNANAGVLSSPNIVIDRAGASTNANLDLGKVAISQNSGDVIVGSVSVARVNVNSTVSVSGNVSVQAANVSVSANVLSGGNNPAVTISANVLDVDNAVTVKATGGDVTLLANTAGRGIMLGGSTTSALLEISDTELNRFFATNLRIGDSSTANVYIAGDITLDSQKVTNLIIRAAGNVLAQSGAKITAANLAIQAGGLIDLVGENAVGGNVALNGSSGVSYSSAVSYSPATVSGFTPVFGVGVAVSQTNSPAVQNRNAFLAVTFNPPPQFAVTDTYSNTLDSNNRLAASYTVSATVSQGTGTVTGLTATFGGVYSFDSLRVDTNPGTYSFTITVDDGISPFTTSSVDYNVQSGDPQQLIVTATDSTAPSGQASFSYAVSVQDQGGNAIVAGTNANITVSASVSGAVLVSGGQVQADNTGTATFTDLIITGSVSSQISISFYVEFTNNNNVFTTVSSAVSAVTLTPGTATQLRIDDASQSVANRSTLSALVIDLLDAQGNIVYDRTDEISVSIGSGSGATLVGTSTLSFTAGASSLAQLTFDNLALQGTVGSYRLHFESDQAGIASVSHDVTLTHGVAASLTISQIATNAQSGINISNQPEITIVDADDNTVLTGATASASISASVSGAGYAVAGTGVDLSGETSVSAASGVAAFSDLRLTGKVGSYTLSFEIPGTALSVSQVIEVKAGTASKFNFIQLPQDVEAGQEFAQTVSAEILDATDNRVLTAGSGTVVQAVWDVNGVGGSFGVTYGFVPNQGLIEFNGLNWSIANTYSLRIEVASGSVLTGIAATSSPLFVVSPAGPSKIQWAGSEPTTGVSNGLLDVQPSFVIKDQFNNEVQQAPLVTVSASVVSANSGDVISILGGTATNSGNQFVNFSGLGLEALVGDYVLSFSAEVSAGVFASVSTSQPVTITHGSLSALVLVTPAASAGSDIAFDDQPVLELRDTAGNRVSTSAQAGLTVRASQPGLSKANDGADLGGTIDVAAQDGVVNFTNLKLTGKVASYSLSYTVLGSEFSTSQNITLAAGDPDSFRFLQQPTDFVAGNGFSPAVSAEVIDAEGNRVLSASNQVNVVWAMNGIGSYGLTFGFVPNSGVLDLSALNFTKAASYKLRLESTGLNSVNSDTFVIGHDVAAGLEWIVDPTGGWQSGKDITTLPKLRVVDQYNNAVSTGPAVTVSASVIGANSSGVLAVTGNEASGVEEVEFANLNITAVADSYVFSFSAEVNGVTFGSITTSGTIDITHGDPTQLTVITTAAGARAGLAFTQSPVLEIQDSAGNRVEDSSLTVSVTSSAQVLIGTEQTNASAGTASFAVDLGLEGSSSAGITLTYKTTFNGQDITTSQTIDLLAGLPSSLRILQDASTVSTRAVFSPVPSVEVLDAYGNVVLSDNDSEVTVALYRNNTAISSESDPVTASSGVVTFNGLSYIATPNSNYKLQFSHNSISAVVTSSPFVIEPGPVAKVVIHQQPRTITGGVTTTMTGELFEDDAVVRLYDIDDNLVDTVDSGVITATITSGTGGTLISASASINNGSAVFDEMRLVGVVETPQQSAEEYKLTFNYGAFSSSESDVLKVKHNVASKLSVVQSAAGGQVGLGFTTKPVIRVLDRYDNWVSTGTQVTITTEALLQSGSGNPSATNVTAQTNNGEATSNVVVTGKVENTYRLRFVGSIGGNVFAETEQTDVILTHGEAVGLNILRQPSSNDGSGNLTKTGSALNVQPVVEVIDVSGNRVLSHTGTITASLSSVVRGERDYLIANTASAVAGVAAFSSLAIVGEIGTSYTLNFYRQGFLSNPALSTGLVLTHGDAEYLTIETQPAGGNKTGSALSQSPTIAVRDFDGNITTTLNSETVSAVVFSGGGAVDTTGSNTDKASVVNGIAQFSNLTVVALPGVDQSLVFTLDGAANSASGLVTSSASVTFSLIVSDAYQLSVFTEPCTAADCTAGPTAERLGVQPVVEVQDRFGNRVEGFSGLVTATLQGTGGSLRDDDGQISSRSVAVVSGLASFTDLRIEGVPGNNYSLQFATSGLQSTTSQDVQVIHTTPSQLVITQQPIGGVTGDELTSQPVVEVRDRFGNLAATDNTTQVSVSVFSGPSRPSGLAAEITGSLTVTAVNGVATFTGLELFAKTGENYVLRFATSGFDVLSNGVVVSPAGANRLEWVTEPVAQRTGEVMNVQPVLRMLDFDGNIASSTAATVVASVSSGGGYIEAGTSSSAVEGIITFAGLTLVAPPNVDQTLTFTATTASGSFSITTSNALNVQHTAASAMSIDVGYATSNEQGLVLGTQPVIKLYDRFGNLTVNDNSTVVTATIGSGAGGAISGSATATAIGGVVTFAGLAVTGSPGVDYTLDFSAGSYGVAGTAQLRLFKTAALEVSYSNIVYSSSPTTSPAVAFTDSTEHGISYSVSTPQFCTINATSGEVSIVGAGTCVIQVSVADGTYYKATSKDVTLTITKAQQDPVVITNNDYVNFGEVLTLTSSGGSSTAPTRFFATGECQILGDKLITFGSATEGSAATCTILASRNGDANYLASTAAPMDIEIRRVAQQPISIGNARNISVGDVELFLIGGSGNGSVSYEVQIGTNTAGCAVTNGVLSATKNGSCEVVATKAQSTNYNVASSPVATFTFTKQTQTVTITSAAPSMPLPGQSFQVAATASGATTISYAVTKGQAIAETQFVSASPAVCQLSQSVSGQVTFLRSGECEVTATAASSDKFASATAKIRILIGQLNQFITFDALADRTYGDPAFRLTAVASSGLPVSYTVSNGVSVCSISNGMVTINAAGVCEITASQAGNGSYAPAPNVVRSFAVNPGLASSPALISAAVGNQWFTLRFSEPSYNGGSPILAYRLEVRDQNDNLYVSTTTNTQSPLSVTAVGIPNNTPYTAKVTAITAAGLGQFSNTTVPLTPSDAAMSVTQLSADTSTSGLEMSWVTPEAIEGNFLRYEIYTWVTGTEEPQTPTVTLTDSTSDTVTVAISSISNDVSVSPASYVAPRLEIVQPLFRPNGGVHIFGAAKTKPIGFFALASISQPNTASATVGYTMRVVTITDVKSSSQVVNTATGYKVGLSAPSAPTQFNIDSSDPTKLVITWAAPNSDGGFPVIDYQVSSNGQVICANIQTRICEVSPLSLSTTYNIEVKARNALGHGDAAAGSHTTPDPEPVVNTTALNEQTLQLVSNLPKLSVFQPRLVRPGEVVTVTGEKLDILNSLSLGGAALDFTVLGANSLTFTVPVTTEPGNYNIIHTSAFGTVTVMDALTVVGTPVSEESEPADSTENEVPVAPEATTPEAPVAPESGSQAPNGGSAGADRPQTPVEEPSQPAEPNDPEPEQTSTPRPTPTTDSGAPAEPKPEDEVIVASGRDNSPAIEFSVSLAMIIAMLLALFVLRYRQERQ